MTAATPILSPWSLGDFHVIGAAQTIVGELLCEDAALGAGNRVLDVACGSGNTALAAARRRNRVTGLDLVQKLAERARKRAQAEGFEIDFHIGNCHELPFEDESFDYVLSTFGVMFALDQQQAANELLRVCKPGGTIALANWTQESMVGAILALSAKYGPPPPPNFTPPIRWGSVAGLQRLFGGRVSGMRLYDRCTYARFVGVDDMVATFKTYFGPMKMLFETMPLELRDAATEEFREVVLRYNRAADGTLAAAMAYINVILTKA